MVIIPSPPHCRGRARLRALSRQFRQELQDVGHNAYIRNVENWRFGVFVDGDDERIALQTGQVLERAAHAAGQINLRPHGLARGADLPGFVQPPGVDYRTGAADHSSHGVGQFFRDRTLSVLDAPSY